MAIELPGPISAYFEADKSGDAERVGQCFTMDATVKDEGNFYKGRQSIQDWKRESSKKFTYTCTPIKVENSEGRTIVTGHLVGDFPGSPIDLRFFFKIQNGNISELEIIP